MGYSSVVTRSYSSVVADLWDYCVGYCGVAVDLWDSCVGNSGVEIDLSVSRDRSLWCSL